MISLQEANCEDSDYDCEYTIDSSLENVEKNKLFELTIITLDEKNNEYNENFEQIRIAIS